MPDCDYCDSRFEDEESYLDHLASAHYDDLDRIDRRRVDQRGEETSGVSPTTIAAVAVIGLLVVAGGGYALLSGDQPAEDASMPSVQQRPSGLGQVHEHGTMVVRIDGRTLDFSREEFQLNDDYFHFENFRGDRFHVHGRGVTLQFALDTLGIGVTRDRVVWQGESYRRSDPGTNISITANGDPVDPATYVLGEGDHVEVVVNTTG